MRFLSEKRFDKILIITTTDKIQENLTVPNNVEIILFSDLKDLCNEEELGLIEFIRNFSIHQETQEKELKRVMILDCAKEMVKRGQDISNRDIERKLKLDVCTYFKDIYEVYEKAGIPIPINKIRARCSKDDGRLIFSETWKSFINSLLEFIKREVSKGHYPSGIDIGKHFDIPHIWTYVKVSDLYKMLDLPDYFERRKLGLQGVR